MAQTRFHGILEERIKEAVENRRNSIASGHCSDYPAYRENVGYLLGLQDVLKLCDEIEKDFS